MKPYMNSLIVGNSSMLGCIDQRGELVRLYWPDIDHAQHIDRLNVGVICPNLWQGASWLDSEDWLVKQYYMPDTNIAVTELSRAECELIIRQFDFVSPERDVFTRYYEVENTGISQLTVSFTVFSSAVSSTPNTAGILFDMKLSALIHYKHSYYYSLSSSGAQVQQYQLGGGAKENAGCGQLSGNDVIGMMKEGALIWESITLGGGGVLQFGLRLCLAHDLKSLRSLLREFADKDPNDELQSTRAYWHSYLTGLRQINTCNVETDALYRRSLLVFALMTNKRTGALLAAPEIDEEFTRCGRYAYCWGRDAAFIATALDKCGLSGDVERFYRWTAKVQDEDGSWQQRFYTDGNLAPSWGLQVDEGGSIIWGILKHYETTGNIEFLRDLWPSIKRGVGFLLSYIDTETGLPCLSFDLWEERLGEHAYSSAAVYAGIEAGAAIARILADKGGVSSGSKAASAEESMVQAEVITLSDEGQQTSAELKAIADKWENAADGLRKSIESNFWRPDWNRFVRSVRVKLNGWGEEHTQDRVWLKTNALSIIRDYSLLDGVLDISLLGLSVPFDIYSAEDPRMVSTAQIVEKQLGVHQAGGLMRYEYDGYIGGNPWVLATLWAALYHIEKKSYKKALDYLNWAVKSATDQGLLPEQVDRNTGKPAWVIPLTWSHAMFILVLDGLIEAGELSEGAAD